MFSWLVFDLVFDLAFVDRLGKWSFVQALYA
jgi:hypothetical protein